MVDDGDGDVRTLSFSSLFSRFIQSPPFYLDVSPLNFIMVELNDIEMKEVDNTATATTTTTTTTTATPKDADTLTMDGLFALLSIIIFSSSSDRYQRANSNYRKSGE